MYVSLQDQDLIGIAKLAYMLPLPIHSPIESSLWSQTMSISSHY